MTVSALSLSPEAVQRADDLRARLQVEKDKVTTGQRKVAKAIKVGFALTDRCDVPGIEGRLVNVSTTGAIILVRDAATKKEVEIPNREITSMEFL